MFYFLSSKEFSHLIKKIVFKCDPAPFSLFFIQKLNVVFKLMLALIAKVVARYVLLCLPFFTAKSCGSYSAVFWKIL